MVEASWEKPLSTEKPKGLPEKGSKLKFLIGGLILLGAVAYLLLSGAATGARFFITVDDLVASQEYVGQTVRITGAVLGETIQYDSENLILDFTIANIPAETENLALTLHEAVTNPNAAKLAIHMDNEVMPDLLQHEAQAILTGRLGDDGIFYASELLLKCPSRYEEAVPGQAIGQES